MDVDAIHENREKRDRTSLFIIESWINKSGSSQTGMNRVGKEGGLE